MKTHHIAGVAAIAFGLLTLISGGSALFGLVDMGAVVAFVLWFNFLAGFAYVIGGRLLMIGHRLALPVALTILIANATVFAVFGWRVFCGGCLRGAHCRRDDVSDSFLGSDGLGFRAKIMTFGMSLL